MAKNLLFLTKVVGKRVPQESHTLLIHSSLSFFFVQPWNEDSFKAKVAKKRCISSWMTKWINMPTNFRSDSEFFEQECMSQVHIVDQIFIIWTGLIGAGPSTLCYFKPTTFDQLLDLLLDLRWLSRVPHLEKLHFNISEFSCFFFLKLLNHAVEYEFYSSVWNFAFETRIVLIDCFHPADVVVGVWNYMNC